MLGAVAAQAWAQMLAVPVVRVAAAQGAIIPYPLERLEHQILAAVAADIIEVLRPKQAAPASWSCGINQAVAVDLRTNPPQPLPRAV
jgi:hypothetical protein